MFFDKPEGNIIFGQPGIVPFLQSVSYQNGRLAAPTGGGATVPTIFGMSSLDPKLRVARNAQYSLSVQKETPYGFLLEAAYVGNQARHLLRQPNINTPTFAAAVAAAPGVTANQIRPYLGYIGITQFTGDGTSNYNAMQVSGTKRRGSLMLTLNYTWSKSLGTNSGEGDNPEPECPFTCLTASGTTVSWKAFWYGRTSFDRTHILSATYTYELPFFKNRHDVLGESLGGWSLSGITRAQSGQYLTVTGTQSIGPAVTGRDSESRRASIIAGQPIRSGYTGCPAGKICWFNPNTNNSSAAFSLAPTTSAGTAPVGNIQGPGYFGTDLSLRKSFTVFREVTMLFQADAFNVFNKTNWQNPGTSVSSGLGIITGSNPPRQVQFGTKLNF
jgi:hypothetical protein